MTDTTAATPFLSAAALHGDLEDWGPLAEATGDADADRRARPLWADGDLEVGRLGVHARPLLLEAGDQRGDPHPVAAG